MFDIELLQTWELKWTNGVDLTLVVCPRQELTNSLHAQVLETAEASNSHFICVAGVADVFTIPQFAALRASSGSRRSRAKLLAPFMEHETIRQSRFAILRENEETPIPHDLDDWRDGTSATSWSSVVLDGISIPELGQSLKSIQAAITDVSVDPGDCIPLAWDNSGYQLNPLSLHLEVCRPPELGLRVLMHGNGAIEPSAAIHDQRGSSISVKLERTTLDNMIRWRPLSDADGNIVNQCLASSNYVCPHCASMHASSKLYCENGASILGLPVLKSLGAKVGEGAALFRRSADSFEFVLLDRGIIPTTVGCAIRQPNGMASQLVLSNSDWQLASLPSIQSFETTGGEVYALFP